MAAKINQTRAPSSCPSDFSAPWKFSDVVLIVEDQRFHVHRSTLAFWSPVFEKMFTTDLMEKTSDEIPLPEKKASEFKELLQMMYPSLEEKVVNKRNCYFLFELAHEYQIESIAQKCEALMVSMVKKGIENDVLAMLIYGQKYQMKMLISTCIYEARRLTLEELKEHCMRDQIEADNYLKIAEGIIQRLEGNVQQLQEKHNVARKNSLAKLCNVSRSLYNHCCKKGTMKSSPKYYHGTRYSNYNPQPETTDSYLSRLNEDVSKINTTCDCLAPTAEELRELEAAIQTL